MKKLDLNGIWEMKRTDLSKWVQASVPGSVMNDLLTSGEIDDPFYRDNELQAKAIASYDYEYKRRFTVLPLLLAQEHVMLCCDGIDTLASVQLNGEHVADTNNMHRRYTFDIGDLLHAGENEICITLFSPVRFIEQADAKYHLYGDGGSTIPGIPYLRKAHCMFGWDWGPQIPDLGIWRNIYILGQSGAKIDDVYITQTHNENTVNLAVRVGITQSGIQPFQIEVEILDPNGHKINAAECLDCIGNGERNLTLTVTDPLLWWPNGLGEQPLYRVSVSVIQNNQTVDTQVQRVGLRTLGIRNQPDEWGESFEFVVNGVAFFAMGANYIPEDSILARCNPERTSKLLQQCVDAHFNCVRVWGGGTYPEDSFYDYCDSNGLVVWQDLMFACAVYELTDEFAENITDEIIDNMKRIRHHACLGLWCGNNEIELAWDRWDIPQVPKLKTDYIKQFEVLLPKLAKQYDPNTFYWLASPSSGGGFDKPNDENRGDSHYWYVWHGLLPFTDYQNHFFRFISEFGFQSFPCLKTVEFFTLPEDRNIFSYIMERHQKNGTANGKILFYLADHFKYPKDFDSLLYVSQVLQAEAMKCGVEHWRRNRGRCMGALYWQLNDCWPVASWASIDSAGRWKALHYYAKRFFAPVLLSALNNQTDVILNVSNETRSSVNGIIMWRLITNNGEVLKGGEKAVSIKAMSTLDCLTLDFSEYLKDDKDKMKTYLSYSLVLGNIVCSQGTMMFIKEKHFKFMLPEISLEISEQKDTFDIFISSKALAKHVELCVDGIDCIFSDNYFDLSPDICQQISISKTELLNGFTAEELSQALHIRSIQDASQC